MVTATALFFETREVFSLAEIPRNFLSLSDVHGTLSSSDYSRAQHMAVAGEIESLKMLTFPGKPGSARIWVNPDNMKCLDEESVRLLQGRLFAVRSGVSLTAQQCSDAKAPFKRLKFKTRIAREVAALASVAAEKQAQEEMAAVIEAAKAVPVAALPSSTAEKPNPLAERLLAAMEAATAALAINTAAKDANTVALTVNTAAQTASLAALSHLEKIWAD